MTNRDKINAMSDYELSEVLNAPTCSFCIFNNTDDCGKCFEGVEGWLKSCTDENLTADNKSQPADNVNHPAHYNREGAMECIREMVVAFGYEATINFCKLNAWKYRYRASEKNGAEDMAKSDWYVKKIEELTAEGYL